MKYDLVIQLVNYNTKKYLIDCLNDVIKDLQNSEINYVISVLDNNSSDDLKDLEKIYKDKKVFFYYSKNNLGFGGGHNFLAKKYDGKYLLLLNADLKFIETNSIQRLFDYLEENKISKTKVVGPKLVEKNGKTQRFDHGELNGFLAKIIRGIGNTYWKDRNEIIESSYISGAVFMMEKRIFDEIGGFDENFFLYKEEEDLCLRLREKNYKVIYYPLVKILHFGSVVAKKSKHMENSHRYFIDKHFKNKKRYYFVKFISEFIFFFQKIFNVW